jgi:beta-lactamase regulating signal transducer with metallopeptidase domain
MTATLLEYAIGNTLLAAPLAAIAWAIGRGRRNPSITHLAWVLVMLRLVLPPVLSVQGLSIELPIVGTRPANAVAATPASIPARTTEAPAQAQSLMARVDFAHDAGTNTESTSTKRLAPLPGAATGLQPWHLLVAVWIAGTAVLLVLSARRIARFGRMLQRSSEPAPPALVGLAERAAARLGMPLRAQIRVTSAGTVPFVWSCLGRPRIVLPASLAHEMPEDELLLVLTHELAHVRRRDHLVRWLDSAVIAWLWWNPLAWIARRGLRACEELACDALVLRTRGAAPRSYGSCLISVAESISIPAFRAPAQVCTMGDRGSLEERIRLIMSDTLRTTPSVTLRTLTVAAASASMLLGVACGSAAQTTAAGSAPPPSSSTSTPPPAPTPPAAPAPPAPESVAASNDSEDKAGDARTRTLQASIDGATALQVELMNGSIQVVRDDSVKAMQVTAVVGGRGWSASDAKRRKTLERVKLVTQKDASGRISVSVDFPETANNLPNVDITIRTPALTSLEATTMNGSVGTKGDFGPITVETMNGTVDIAGAKAAVHAQSMNGEVRIALAAGATEKVDAECTNGKVSLELPSSWNGAVEASVTNGRVTAEGIKGSSDRSWTGEDFAGTAGSGGSTKATLSVVNGSVWVNRS